MRYHVNEDHRPGGGRGLTLKYTSSSLGGNFDSSLALCCPCGTDHPVFKAGRVKCTTCGIDIGYKFDSGCLSIVA